MVVTAALSGSGSPASGGGADRLDRGAKDADAVLVEDAGVSEGDGEVEAGLAAQGGQEAVRPLAPDDAGDYGDSERLNVDGIGDPLVGHDGSGVGVDENGVDALFAEGAAGLRAGAIELRGLADDDGAGADDEDALRGRGHGR